MMDIKELYNLSNKKSKLAVGLMSGTSLDGVDAVLIEITGSGTNTKIKQLGFITYPFPAGMREMILRNAEFKGGNVTEICQLNFLISLVYVDAIKALCKKVKIPIDKIDLVGSHGQTVHHLPQNTELFGYSFKSTLQIGDPSVIAKKTGILTVGDFRTGDVALGGQGAPLVPYFDYILFHSDEKNRALLNIGGISNFTILDKNGTGADVIAFDTGPGNMLIDQLAKKFFKVEYDKNGDIAASGSVNDKLLNDILKHDEFVNTIPPKSSGREYYGKNFVSRLTRKFKNLPHEDWLATVTDYTAFAIYRNYDSFVKDETAIEELFVSGGGSRNKNLMRALKKYFGRKVSVKNVRNLGISSDAKEAICFAVLANETVSGNSSNIPRVTGAEKATILGKICLS